MNTQKYMEVRRNYKENTSKHKGYTRKLHDDTKKMNQNAKKYMKYIENMKNCLFFIQFKGFQVLLTYWFVF